jgi:hypothetical protein
MTMSKGDGVWGGDWRAKIRARLQETGCESVAAFLGQFPAEPYTKTAERLGNDVAAFQLEWMQFEERKGENDIRSLAMDSLARDVSAHLPSGWRPSAKEDFETAGVYADWVVRLQQAQPEAAPKAKAVWAALEALQPPVGWKPSGPDDPLIVSAFGKAWPST